MCIHIYIYKCASLTSRDGLNRGFNSQATAWIVNLEPRGDVSIPRGSIYIGPKVVPFWGSYLELYKVISKRNYFGAYGYTLPSWNSVPKTILGMVFRYLIP